MRLENFPLPITFRPLDNPAARKNKLSYWKNKIQRLKVIVSMKETFPEKKLSLDDVVCDWKFLI